VTQLKHQPGLEPVLEALRSESQRLGARASLVGGYVRDRLLDRECKDIDVVAEQGKGLDLAAAVAAALGAREPVIFERFGTAQVTHGSFLIEFVSARAESYDPASRKPDVRPGTLEEDIWRRDFTVNALLSDVDGNVTDVTGLGIPDLDAKILRTPLPARETFAEDPLRMVRAVRFAATLGFKFDGQVPAAIAECLPRLRPGEVVSMERISEEIRKMLLSAHPGEALRLMHETGMLALVLPEVAGMAGVEQTGFHNRDVLNHTLDALEADAAAAVPAAAANRGEEEARLVGRLAILFHDTGKPATMAKDGDRITFLGHPEVGAELARDALRRLRFSNDEAEATALLVRLHMRPIQYLPEEWTDGAVRRLVRDAGDQLDALLRLARADMAASDYPAAEAERKIGDLERRMEEVGVEEARGARAPLTGEQVMERYGRGPGPWLGRVKQALLDAVLEGDLPAGQAGEVAAWSFLETHPELLEEAP
jgi:poly(A) polymerase